MNVHDKSRYHEVHARSLADPEGFWGEAAREIDWIEPAKKVFDPGDGPLWPLVRRRGGQHLLQRAGPPCRGRPRRPGGADPRFAAGESGWTSTSPNSPMPNCWREVQTLAAIMQDFGVAKGDRVILYMPMVPEAMIAMLACARIGAVHSVVFGGFAAKELATRIEDAKPKLIFSASCGLEPGRLVQYKPLLDEAIKLSSVKPEACIILQRPQQQCDLIAGRDHDWAELRGKAHRREKIRRLRAGAGDRSALHSLHVGHHRQTQGRGARQWRPSGRAEMVDVQSLRRQAGRSLVVRQRHRLGGRPQLHHLCAAVSRRDLDHV